MTPAKITVVVIAYNESQHIRRCLDSAATIAYQRIVVDSGSTDDTRDLARNCGAEVYQHEWSSHSAQVNWALSNVIMDGDWVFRLDADEFLTDSLAAALPRALAQLGEEIAGVTVNRQMHFLGKWVRWGGMYPIRSLRLWRRNRGQCEARMTDEHIVVSGGIVHVNEDIIDDNQHSLSRWIDKHNKYATREAYEVIVARNRLESAAGVMSRNALIKRSMKLRLYNALPSGARAGFYFLYRYFLLCGFLDGKVGLFYHGLQAFWYRLLVDAKIHEIDRLMARTDLSAEDAVRLVYSNEIPAK